jgi:hypothetical protein
MAPRVVPAASSMPRCTGDHAKSPSKTLCHPASQQPTTWYKQSANPLCIPQIKHESFAVVLYEQLYEFRIQNICLKKKLDELRSVSMHNFILHFLKMSRQL